MSGFYLILKNNEIENQLFNELNNLDIYKLIIINNNYEFCINDLTNSSIFKI